MLTPLECALIQKSDYRKKEGYPDWYTLPTDKYDTQFFMTMRKDEELVICFCPSNSKIDWKNNFHFWKVAYKDCEIPIRVHSGFLRCWKEVRRYIEACVKQMNPRCITITGWSYGGAMAVLCKEDLQWIYPLMEIQCITFGAPRVIGFLNFKKVKDRWKNTKQFKNGSDVVTAVPLMSMLFTHVSELIHIGQPIRFWRYLFPGPKKYHEIDDYINTMKKISTDSQ